VFLQASNGRQKANWEPRYFAVIGKSPFTSPESDIVDQSLIEWEESILRHGLSNSASATDVLRQTEQRVATSSFGKTPLTPPAPAEIILFATLYSPLTALSSSELATVPNLKSWFFELALSSPWALNGVEQAAIHTSKPTLSSTQVGAEKPIVPKIEYASNIKEGVALKVLDPGVKVLPKKGEKNILITSALPYVNNVPHLGTIVGCVLSADVYARWSRARGYNTLFVCGTDEYGTATETKAIEDGVTPQQLCDKYFALHRDIYKWFECGFDYFGRTTTEKQTEICQSIFLKLHKNGYLEEKSSTQLYCETHSSFLADRFVEGECPRCHYEDARGDQCDKCGNLLDPFELIKPRCKLDGATPIPRDTKHIHLLLDKLQPAIEKWTQKSSIEGTWSKNGRIITESWLKEGLKDRGITRDLKWGVPVPLPGYEKKVFYVWFDACIGYVSITANYTDEWKQWWYDPENVKLYQFMGKDNVPFHTVVFPGSQIGTGDSWTMLNTISTTEYLQYEGGKFSKSRNIGVFGNNAQDTGVPVSVWRYYLMSARPESSDTQFEWKTFIAKNNSELLANFGNLVNRLIKLVNAKYDSIVPDYVAAAQSSEYDGIKADVNVLLKAYNSALDLVQLRLGLEKLMALSTRGNQFLQENKLDNSLLANEPARAAAVVGIGLNLIYLLSALTWPFMPSTAESIVEQLNAPLRSIPESWSFEDGGDLRPGHKINKAKYLFSRIDEGMADKWRAQFGGGSGMDAKKEDPAKGKGKGKDKKQPKKDKSVPAAAAEKISEKAEAAVGEVKEKVVDTTTASTGHKKSASVSKKRESVSK
jgi:methionyl-tRNA synthetase